MEFAHAGARVVLLSPRDHPARVTDVLSDALTFHAINPVGCLERAMTDVRADLVLPCDERAVRLMHRLHEKTTQPGVRQLIERSLGPPQSFPVATTRHDLLMLAHHANVRTPRSMPLGSIDDLSTWAADQPFPWVVKADGSWSGFGVRVVHDLAAAQAAYEDLIRPITLYYAVREAFIERNYFSIAPWFRRDRACISVQSYVDGWPANCAVACWNGKVLAGICAESVTTESATGPSSVARVIDNPEMLDAAERVVARLGLSGLVGFDFMIEASTGTPYMIEMNPRCTPIATVRLGPGRDLTAALVQQLTGGPPRERPAVTERDIIVFFPHTWEFTPDSPFLHTGYHNVPWEQPALVRALVRAERRERSWILRHLRKALLAWRRRR